MSAAAAATEPRNPAHTLTRRRARVDAAVYAPPEPRDFCTNRGAARLKARIEDYWRKRGCDVQVALVPAPYESCIGGTRHDVRSDLVDGLPRGARL